MKVPDVRIEESWKQALLPEFSKDYFIKLAQFVRNEYQTEKIYPPPQEIFNAFSNCPIRAVRVVILGQDPYHGAHQANGLAFSIRPPVSVPPSLKNIFNEVHDDTGADSIAFRDGDLTCWAEQGVLLLNATLTVRAGSPGSHQGKGWEKFTDAVVSYINAHHEHVVFMLWGNYAKQKGAHIDRTRHLVIESAHPSPFSAHQGFLGSKPFSKANEYLQKCGYKQIRW